MILLTHLLFGAAISSKIGFFWLAVIMAFLSHYLLDLLPHNEYPIGNILNNQWRKSFPDFLKVIADFCLGIFLIFLLSDNSIKTYTCAIVTIIPDGLTFLEFFWHNKFLKKHNQFHREEIHILKKKKIPLFWRFLTQIIIIILSILLLKS